MKYSANSGLRKSVEYKKQAEQKAKAILAIVVAIVVVVVVVVVVGLVVVVYSYEVSGGSITDRCSCRQ